jgi:hypothetical protein
MQHADAHEGRFRAIFRAAHAGHSACASDEWLNQTCLDPDGSPAARPIVLNEGVANHNSACAYFRVKTLQCISQIFDHPRHK